ncbi:ankyrin repeat domain-containing protein 17-like [Ostrea edulis]|uniref:ankyrin repeat domain-containing protein 17-like n=1 Tax=Ostrea edulis TaxID=37623 RepID=UPI0024AEDBF3|nr:ankyrin repeat domain-containing protein 17-like [Ostrea edulis]
MASSYESTPETTNANRACRVVLGPCTDSLRDLLRHYVPPHTFHHVIKQNKLNLPRLNRDQRDLILPRTGNYAGNYGDMDISLLYILLRNISSIPPHSNGWGNDPDPSDKSVSANIEKIRLVRNLCVHSSDPSMSISDFNSIWSTIRSAMVDMDVFLMNGNKYEKEVDFLHSESMDPENDLHYEEELKKQVEEDKTTRKMMVSLKRKFEETAEETKKLHGKVVKLTESPIPPNVREQYDIEVQRWREEDKLYYETHNFPSVMQKVRNQPYVTFVVVPGSGKSATAHHIALKLQEEGYEVVPAKDIRKMEDYGDPRNPQVFVIDDVVGVFGLQKTNLDVLTNYEKKITQPLMDKSRTLMTCRETVYNETLPYKAFVTKDENVIKLHSSDNALDDEDKKQIFKKYGLKEDLISPELLTSTSHMFPLLCKLFSKETKFKALGPTFFLNPVQCISDELDNMQRLNKLNYATLVLCMLSENSISKDILKHRKNEHFMKKKCDTLENCELENQTDAFKFVKALSAMEGTYTKQCGAQYTLMHDSMFEICAYQYGKQFPDQMLLYMSSSYIANYVKPQTSEPGIVNKMKEKKSVSQSSKGGESSNNCEGKEKESDDTINERGESFDLCIRLREDQYPLLAERLYRDIQNMKLYDVFGNQVLKHPQVCWAFIGVLKTKSYTDLKSLFLSSQGKVDNIVRKRGCMEKETACEGGHVSVVEELVKAGADINLQNYDGDTPLAAACELGHVSVVVELVKAEADVNLQHRWGDTSLIDACGGGHNRQGNTSLIAACEGRHVSVVEELVKAGADVNLHNRRGDTSLTAACEEGHVSVVEELVVKAGADVYLQNRWGETPLTAACNLGHVSVVEELVKAGADVNLQDNPENTALTAACKEGHVSVVEELVKAGTDVNLQDNPENTPLTAACKEGHVSVVEKLVKAGTDVNLQNGWGDTPLIAACEGGHVSVVEKLVKAGADVNLQNRWGDTPLRAACYLGHVSVVEELVKAGADVYLQSRWGDTPLIAACYLGHVSVVEELVKAGADVNLQNRWGDTPLVAACKEVHVSVVEELLVKVGADVNLQNRLGDTPLIAACKEVHVSVVEELVKAGTDVNLQNRWGDTPLIAVCEGGHNRWGDTPLTAACERGDVSVVEELVKAGADVNLQNRWGDIPLTAACRKRHMSVVEELVKSGADVNLQNRWGDTPLTAACREEHSVMEELVKAGVDLKLQKTPENTPLTAACKEEQVSVVEELVKAGAVVNRENRWEYTPLKAACEGGHVRVVEELVKAGADVNL